MVNILHTSTVLKKFDSLCSKLMLITQKLAVVLVFISEKLVKAADQRLVYFFVDYLDLK